MGSSNIKKDYFFYKYLHNYLKWTFLHYYNVKVFGSEKLEKGSAYIFAPNHQNALIDPLAVLFTYQPKMVFYARADIFKNPLIANFLYSIKMLPVFRIRDGYDQIKKNQEIFDITLEMVSKGNGLVVFPEANHFGQRQLRALKKGLVRVAFQSQDKYPDVEVKIVPVGLDYSHYHDFDSELIVNYGNPISVKEYMQSYHDNPNVALLELNKKLKYELSDTMIDISAKGDDYYIYDTFYRLAFTSEIQDGNIESKSLSNFAKLFTSIKDHQLSDDIKEDVVKLNKLLIENNIDIDNLSDYNLPTIVFSYIILILFFPLYAIFSLLNLPGHIIGKLSRTGFEDKQFYGTMQYVVGSFASFPLLYLCYFLIGVYILDLNIIMAISLVYIVFISNYFTQSFNQFLGLIIDKWKMKYFIKKSDNKLIQDLKLNVISYYKNQKNQ
jgi:1-acyl-sn-glycerol-3-phosphate acyltransferase